MIAVQNVHTHLHTGSLTCTLSRHIDRTVGQWAYTSTATINAATGRCEQKKRRACRGGRVWVCIGCNQHGAVTREAENDHNSSWYCFPTTRTGAGTRPVRIIDGRVATNVRYRPPPSPPTLPHPRPNPISHRPTNTENSSISIKIPESTDFLHKSLYFWCLPHDL